MKIYVDTNWFLSFYQGVQDRDATLKKLREHTDLFVLTHQNIVEFRRNRGRLLKALRQKVLESTTIKPYTTGLTRGMPEHTTLVEAVAGVAKAAKTLAARIDGIDAGVEDPVMDAFDYLVSKCQILDVTDAIVERAHRRKLRGIPPSSNKRQTIGDEIIWECLLEGCVEDLAVVSLDGDFIDNQEVLAHEFEAHKSHRNLVYVGERLSDALEKFSSLSPEEYRAEYGQDPYYRCDGCGGGNWRYAGPDEESEMSRYMCGNCRQIWLVV